jgi:hypothetical protein
MVNARKSRAQAAAARVAQLRAQQARAERRRRIIAGGSVALVLALVTGLVVAKVVGVGSTTAAATTSATSQLTTRLGTAATALQGVGPGTDNNLPKAITAPALTANGKPRVLYVGAEYCPFCAAQRWAVAVALSRFGTWSGLGQTTSSASDAYPNTPTLSFHGATLASQYLSFTGTETSTNQPASGGGYQPLDTLSAADTALVTKYNAAPYVAASAAGSIPFIDIGGKYVSSGSSFSPDLLAGTTQAQVAAALQNPNDPIAKAVGGAANAITAAICTTTGGQPAAVCTAPGVKAAAAKLGHAG